MRNVSTRATLESATPIGVRSWGRGCCDDESVDVVGPEREHSPDAVPEPHPVPRLGAVDADDATQRLLGRQGRVPAVVEDEVPVPGDRDDPDRPGGRRHGAAPAGGGGRVARSRRTGGDLPGRHTQSCPDAPQGRTGAARLAMDVGCRILAVGIVGTDAIQPPGTRVPKPFKWCSLTIGHPIRPERYPLQREPALAWRTMIDEVMFEIREMTGQDVPRPVRRPSQRNLNRARRGHRTAERPQQPGELTTT